MRFPAPFRLWLSALVCSCAAFTSGSAQDVVLNELMAAGQSIIADEDGSFPDWVELRNAGSAPVEMAGWHLTDELEKPNKWAFPALTLPAGGYLVIFASGKNRAPAAGVLHTSFGFKSGGEVVALTRPDGTVASSFEYPVQIPGLSFDGTKFLTLPTPNAENSPPLAIVLAPDFNQPRGFQEQPFLLTLTSATPGAVIRYTLDGAEPSESSARYAAPLRIAQTTVVRATAFASGAQPSPVVTRTYLFAGDIVQQSLQGQAPPGWPRRWGANSVDYGMDLRIVRRTPYRGTIRNDLQTIPSLSIVMDLADLFDATDGIYANATRKGRDWERPMSLELINPSGDEGFQINAGLRIRGGASRDAGNPKHSFRVLMRTEYGAPELKYPLFGPEGAARTKRFDIRCEQLVAWHYFVDPQADFLRDIFGRDTQGALGQPYKRGDFHHLYINGQYWGLYQTDERISAEYAAEYFGGDEGDYDVVKYDAEAAYGTGFIDGTLGAWRRLFEAGARGFASHADYFKVQGLNPDGSRQKDFERLLEVDSVIDYMLAGLFLNADDSPPSFGTQNNWYGLRSRKDDFGFRFFAHDWEISMSDPHDDRVGLAPEANPFDEQLPETVNPWHYWQALRLNEEFRLRVADRVQKYFFHGGPLTVEAASARWRARMDEIDRAVVGESARWGDARRDGIGTFLRPQEIAAAWREGVAPTPRLLPPGDGGPIIIDPPPRPDPGPGPGPTPRPGPKPKPFTRADWLAGADERVLQGYLQIRSGVMLQQLKDGGLYPSVPAPEITPHGGPLGPEQRVTITGPDALGPLAALVYFTLDGTDPRRIGGAVSSSAQQYEAPFPLAKATTVKARVRRGADWSALVEVEFTPGADLSALRLTEVHYNPPAAAGVSGDEAEFLELHNSGATALDVSGLRFTAGIAFTFPSGSTLAPGAFFTLARNAAVFTEQHPGVAPDGIFTGKLGDDGEPLTLVSASGARVLSVEYDDAAPWPLSADGLGFSLVRPASGDADDGANWRASANRGGSPGGADPAPPAFPLVVINEALAYPAAGGQDAIELHNTGGQAADISGWWLSDEQSAPRKFRVPPGTVIAPGGFAVFDGRSFGAGATSFDLARLGDGVWLASADSAGELTGYVHGFAFGASLEGASFGRHLNSDGAEQFPAQTAPTLGALNAGPRATPLRITEIHYFPDGTDAEFVEIESAVDGALLLEGARLAGFGFTFPPGASIGRGLALVVRGDPAEFRAKYEIPTAVEIFGPASGALQDNGERIELQLPVTLDGETGFFTADTVRYNDRKPWPTGAAGFGHSLQRLSVAPYGDDPQSWLSARPSPGESNSVNAAPRVALTAPRDGDVVRPPRKVQFAAEASDADGEVAKVEFLVDEIVVGEDVEAPFMMEWTPTPGLHDLSARAVDREGAVGQSEFVTIDVDAPEGGTGLGLRGEYFGNPNLLGEPTVRDDAAINFDWAEIPPLPALARDSYSVRWTGKLLPRVTGEHQLFVTVAGGVRLYAGDALLIDQWEEAKGGETSQHQAALGLVAGETIELRVEYAERDGFGGIDLRWSEPGDFDQPIIAQNQLFLPDQDPNAFGIASASELPARRMGRAFRMQLQAVNGPPPFRWTVESVLPSGDSQLPPGLTLSASGVLSGTPTKAGWYAFAVRVHDAAETAGGRVFKLRITDASHPELRPRVTIATPLAGARLGGGAVMLRGSVSAPRGLAALRYSVNFGTWHAFPARVSWSVRLDALRGLRPGLNEVRVLAVDREGRESIEAGRRFHRAVFAPLLVTVEGAGTITPAFLGVTQREIGKSYSITAHPAPGFILREWRGAFGSERRLDFTMFEGAEITAVFSLNPFTQLAGAYAGLLSGETIEHRTRGLFTLAVTRTGVFTAALNFAGRRHLLRGRLLPDGSHFTSVEISPGEFLSLSLQLRPETADFDVRAGVFTGETFAESTGIAVRSAFNERTAPCPFAETYTLALPDPDGDGPIGSGRATLEIDRAGRARLAAELGDGAVASFVGRMRDDSKLAIYVPLYGGTGAISGELQFISEGGLRGSGSLFWSRAATGLPPFPDGFSATFEVSAEIRAAVRSRR